MTNQASDVMTDKTSTKDKIQAAINAAAEQHDMSPATIVDKYDGRAHVVDARRTAFHTAKIAGVSGVALAAFFGLDPSTVYFHLRSVGAPANPVISGGPRPEPPRLYDLPPEDEWTPIDRMRAFAERENQAMRANR